MECSKSNSKREDYINIILSQETGKHQIDNLTLTTLKQLEKEGQNPPKLVEGKKS